MPSGSSNYKSTIPAIVAGFSVLLVGGAMAIVLQDNAAFQLPLTESQTALIEETPVITVSEFDKLYEDFHATGEASRAPKDPTLAPAPPTAENPPFPTGIFEGGEGAFYSGDFTIHNRWQGFTDGITTQVFAGSLYQDKEQGVILVLRATTGEQYLTPTKAGAVRVVSIDNFRFVLKSTSGEIFYFDFPSRQFVDSLVATPPPTTTKLPIPTPYVLPTGYPNQALILNPPTIIPIPPGYPQSAEPTSVQPQVSP